VSAVLPPTSILFACNLNRVRSPMAAALMRRRFGDSVRIDSCGLRPADSVDPFAVAVIDELGVDLSGHEPKSFDSLDGQVFDLVVSLSPEAHDRAGEFCRDRRIRFEYWPVSDPTLVEGTRDQRIEAYRLARDGIDRRLAERFGQARTFRG